METELDISNIISGEPYVVETVDGALEVTIFGNQGKTACIAYPEVGLSHKTCFRSLLTALGPQSLLMKNYYIIFIDPPGYSHSGADDAASISNQGRSMTLQTLSDHVHEVIKHFEIKECIGMGVGNGAYVLINCAIDNPGLFAGLFLISPSCKQSGWWEWIFGNATALQLRLWGWTGRVQQHFARRLFSPATLQLFGGDKDLVHAFQRDLQLVPPVAASAYLSAALTRPSLIPHVKGLTSRTLLVYGSQGLYYGDCEEFAAACDKSRMAIIEVPHAGVLVNEEHPTELISPLQLFLTALQLEGIGLGEAAIVGE